MNIVIEINTDGEAFQDADTTEILEACDSIEAVLNLMVDNEQNSLKQQKNREIIESFLQVVNNVFCRQRVKVQV